MVRVGGLTYAFDPLNGMGKRVSDMRLKGEAVDRQQDLQGGGLAPVAEEAAKAGNPMVWELVEQWLKARGKVAPRQTNAAQAERRAAEPGLRGLNPVSADLLLIKEHCPRLLAMA